MFGVTGSDAERNPGAERTCIEAITEQVVLLQRNAAAQQQRPLRRGTHAKGICAKARFEVLDVRSGRDPELARRLARGIFATPGVFPATVRFANADSHVNSDFKADVRSLSFSVELTRDGSTLSGVNASRQDFSLQNTTTLPINDARGFLAIMKVLTASNPAVGLWSLPFKDKLRVFRILALVQVQSHQKIRPYQLLHFGSNVPFRHGPADVVKQSAKPLAGNPAQPLRRSNPNALQDELARHLNEDSQMSGFDIGLQFLDAERMTYWGKRHDRSFWMENASIEWNESQAPFHVVARLTLIPKSQLATEEADAMYVDVTGNSTPDSTPVGSINRARQQGEAASRNARLHRVQQM